MPSLGHPIQFQRILRLGFVTAATSLNAGQPNFARCLAVSWTSTLHIHFPGLLPVMEFSHVKNSLCVQLLRSPILAALLHGTRAVGVSESLWRRTRNRITELSQRPPPILGWATITLGIGPHSSYQQHCVQRKSAGISFTQRPILRFFAPQGRHVAPMGVKLGSVPSFTPIGATTRV